MRDYRESWLARNSQHGSHCAPVLRAEAAQRQRSQRAEAVSESEAPPSESPVAVLGCVGVLVLGGYLSLRACLSEPARPPVSPEDCAAEYAEWETWKDRREEYESRAAGATGAELLLLLEAVESARELETIAGAEWGQCGATRAPLGKGGRTR